MQGTIGEKIQPAHIGGSCEGLVRVYPVTDGFDEDGYTEYTIVDPSKKDGNLLIFKTDKGEESCLFISKQCDLSLLVDLF